jgi:hypothetical protein
MRKFKTHFAEFAGHEFETGFIAGSSEKKVRKIIIRKNIGCSNILQIKSLTGRVGTLKP